MFSYNVLLEGVDSDGTGYFITLEVAGTSQSQAEELALNNAAQMGLTIVGVEEVEIGHQLKHQLKPGILRTYGKSYFADEG